MGKILLPNRLPGLILGTAQLGEEYGSVIKTKPPSLFDAHKILNLSTRYGINGFDTAPVYKNAEQIIGHFLRKNKSSQAFVTTKVSVKEELAQSLTAKEAELYFSYSILKSVNKLGSSNAISVLIHNVNQVDLWGGILLYVLKKFKYDGIIHKIGASIQNERELNKVIQWKELEIIQLPFNLLDKRMKTKSFVKFFKQRENLSIHVRSLYLQGILIRNKLAWPQIKGVDPVRILKKLSYLAKKLNRIDVADLCIGYVRGHDWVDYCLIGMENITQLELNKKYFIQPALTHADIRFCDDLIGEPNEKLVDPSKWPKV